MTTCDRVNDVHHMEYICTTPKAGVWVLNLSGKIELEAIFYYSRFK